jgi:hypothetical protein
VLGISPFYSSYYSRKYNMGAIKNTPAGKEGEGKQSGCKRRVESGCALQIIRNSSTCYITTALQECFSLLKNILNNFYIQKLGQLQAGDKLWNN